MASTRLSNAPGQAGSIFHSIWRWELWGMLYPVAWRHVHKNGKIIWLCRQPSCAALHGHMTSCAHASRHQGLACPTAHAELAAQASILPALVLSRAFVCLIYLG